MKKITIQIERAFYVILWASPATHLSTQQLPQLPTVAAALNSHCSFQQSLQPPAVAVTCGNSSTFISKCQTGKLFPSHRWSSTVTAWYNYIIIATFERLKQPQGLKQPLLVSGAAPIQCFQNCFKLFKIVSNCSYIKSAASLTPNDCYLFDKQSW